MLEKYWWAFPLIGFGLGIGTGWLEAKVYNPWRKKRALEEAEAWETIARKYYFDASPMDYSVGMCTHLRYLYGLSWFTRKRMEKILRKKFRELAKKDQLVFGHFWHFPKEGDLDRMDFCMDQAIEAQVRARSLS